MSTVIISVLSVVILASIILSDSVIFAVGVLGMLLSILAFLTGVLVAWSYVRDILRADPRVLDLEGRPDLYMAIPLAGIVAVAFLLAWGFMTLALMLLGNVV